jgi:hypothetical protein
MRSCCRAGWSSTSGRRAKRSGAARERCGDACPQAGGPVVLGKVAQDFDSRADLVFWPFGSWVAPSPFPTSAHERVGEQFARCVGGWAQRRLETHHATPPRPPRRPYRQARQRMLPGSST